MQPLTIRFNMLLILLCLSFMPAAQAAGKQEIDAKVHATITTFYAKVSYGKELADKAVAMLVFPEVLKAGLAVGGEFGEGAMLEKGKITAHYNTASASIGFQFGVQVKSQIIMFMTTAALDAFKASNGWKAGVDGSIAIINLGAGSQVDSNTIKDPIIGFIFSNKGLMYNLSFEGSKITRIHK